MAPSTAVRRLPLLAFAAAVSAAIIAAPTAAQTTVLTLSGAIDRGLAHSDAARAASATRAAAEHRANAFRASLLPQLTLSGTLPSYNRSIIEVLQPDGSSLFRPQNLTNAALTATVSQPLPFTGGDLFVSSSLARLSVSGSAEDLSWQSTPVMVGLRQPLFQPRALDWDGREQVHVREAARRRYLEAREDIAMEVTARFFAAHAAEVRLANAATNVAVNDTLYRLNTGRYEIGSIGENDLLQSELALLRARADQDAARLELERARAELRLATGLAPGTPIEVTIPDEVPVLDVDTARAVAEALRNASVMSELELQDLRAERSVVAARLDNGFQATLQASYGFNAAAPDASAAYRDLLEAQRVSLSVDVPVWRWGAGGEAVKAAEADRQAAGSARTAAVERTALEARFAALDVAQARRNLALSATADTVAAKRFEIAYNRYVVGRISVDNLYLAQNEKDQARTAYVQALGRYWQSYYRLRRLTLYDFVQDEAVGMQ